jgi:hypothetical protein
MQSESLCSRRFLATTYDDLDIQIAFFFVAAVTGDKTLGMTRKCNQTLTLRKSRFNKMIAVVFQLFNRFQNIG